MSDSTPPAPIRIAALQPELRFNEVMPNLHLLRQTVDRVAGETRLDLVVLPELFDGSGDPTDGASARQFLSTLARSCDVNVVGGSCLITDADGRQFNRCHVIRRGGEEIGVYDKRALFSAEADSRVPGDGPGVFDFGAFRVGILICADLWYPEYARELCGRIDVLAVPAMTGIPTEDYRKYARGIWHSMALTRAMENGYVVAVSDWPEARHGRTPKADGVHSRRTHDTAGASTIVDPSHRPDLKRIQRTLPGGERGVLRSEIDLATLERYRFYRQSVGLLPRSPGS